MFGRLPADCSSTLDNIAELFTEEEVSDIMAFAKNELHMTFDDEDSAIDTVLDLLHEQTSEFNNTMGEYELVEPTISSASEELAMEHSP
eukprot:1735409-Pyramimonas_sp.AAC.2